MDPAHLELAVALSLEEAYHLETVLNGGRLNETTSALARALRIQLDAAERLLAAKVA